MFLKNHESEGSQTNISVSQTSLVKYCELHSGSDHLLLFLSCLKSFWTNPILFGDAQSILQKKRDDKFLPK